jgi:predicted nucleic acid-binding protein
MAVRAVFADTSFFFALAATRDAAHDSAVSTLSKLLNDRRGIITTDYIIDETLTLTKLRVGSRVAMALLDRIERSPAVVVESVDTLRFDEAVQMFRKHADHGYSFTDCTSFVVMTELKLNAALTTDQHFVEAGFQRLLQPQS